MSIQSINNFAPHHLQEGSYTKKIYDQDGEDGLQRYLDGTHSYEIATTTALWGSTKPDQFKRFLNLGALGHHALIRLPGQRIVQLALKEEPWELHQDIMTQLECRSATGRDIERMYQMHKKDIVKYRAWGTPGSFPAGRLFYCPFLNDCFHYANTILTKNGQERTNLSRVNAFKYAYIDTYHTPSARYSRYTCLAVSFMLCSVAAVAATYSLGIK